MLAIRGVSLEVLEVLDLGLGYHALGWAPTSVVLTAVVGLLTGVQVMTARMLGEGRRHAVGAVLPPGFTRHSPASAS